MSVTFSGPIDWHHSPARASSQPPAIPVLATNHPPPRHEVVSQSPLSFHLGNFKEVRPSDATWKAAIDPRVESGKEGLYYRVFTNAKGRLRTALGKDAYDDIDKLTIKERCILCRLITQATKIPGQDKHEEADATELAQAEAREALFALATGSGETQALASKILAKIVVLPSPHNLSDENLRTLITIADLGNKHAVAILMAEREIGNQAVANWLQEALGVDEPTTTSRPRNDKGASPNQQRMGQACLVRKLGFRTTPRARHL